MTPVSLTYDNRELMGEVITRNKFYLEVQLLSPYQYCPAKLYISGFARSNMSFLTDFGDKCIEDLLIKSYDKAKAIYNKLDRFANFYVNLKEEKSALNHLPDSDVKKKISRKLEDWFFHSAFTSSITGIIIPETERGFIFNILDDYSRFLESSDSIELF
ncbi:hypothetical protein GZ212_13040 [Mangrovimonas sp. CR14]|uniref:hypothetical protein n=1 Tax=Mangrovimonas sp. CR14 TaxID=2706120 RepID=UPI00142008EB|nr:hypothetical protein [Mangrovimonas sp. CR14]NIK93082.1 hypothetical protein [Mangrovimonas sp. CR14]